MKKFLLSGIIGIFLLWGVGHTQKTPDKKVCISQSAANQCFDCLMERRELRKLITDLEVGNRIGTVEAETLKKHITELELNHKLTVGSHQRETAKLRKIIQRSTKKQVSFFWGLVKFRW